MRMRAGKLPAEYKCPLLKFHAFLCGVSLTPPHSPTFSLCLCVPLSLTQLNSRFKIHATFFFYAIVIKFNTCPAIPTRRVLLLLLLLSLHQLGVCATQWAKVRTRCVCCRKSFLDSAYTHPHTHSRIHTLLFLNVNYLLCSNNLMSASFSL